MFENKCFIICAIGQPDSETRKRADVVLNTILEPAVSELGLEAVRADHIELPGLITRHVIDYLCEARLVIADLTDSNPNVFYELGVRHALGKPAIHIIDAAQTLPFDLQGMRTILIHHNKGGDYIEMARRELVRQAGLIISSSTEHSVSVLELLGFTVKTVDSLLIDAAREMRREFHRIVDNRSQPIKYEEFASVNFLIDFIRRIDADNGHAHYYAGEVKRSAGMTDEAITEFLKYLDTYDSRPSIDASDDIGTEICYRIAHGYCKQRTGWINHLMAVYFVDKYHTENEPTKRNIFADRAFSYASNALKFYPKGFTQYTATGSIITETRRTPGPA